MRAFGFMKILFLGYGREHTRLIDFLTRGGDELVNISDEVDPYALLKFDLALSFGYRHIIGKSAIRNARRPIINLHMSYLPYNRGAHPNFWAFYEGTLHGVSIHHIDEGIDCGDILYQKKIEFEDYDLTFFQTYQILLGELEVLFMKNWQEIAENRYVAKKQAGVGTFHRKKDLPQFVGGWDARVGDTLRELGTKR